MKISTVRTYLYLAKPERTLNNTLTAIAGYLFASQWDIHLPELAALVFGITLVIASASVLNNYFDLELDRKMERTSKRALPTGAVTKSYALVYAVLLGIFGFCLIAYTNWLTVLVIAVAYVSYVFIYGAAKRRTWHSTLIGTIPGGASIVAGYTAFSGQFDGAALTLFLIMLGWQMVHFYAISIYRLKDYRSASIPLISVTKGIDKTKLFIWFYLLVLIISAASLTFAGYTGILYLAFVLVLGLAWLRLAYKGFTTTQNEQWGRDMFKFSLTALLLLMLFLALGPILP